MNKRSGKFSITGTYVKEHCIYCPNLNQEKKNLENVAKYLGILSSDGKGYSSAAKYCVIDTFLSYKKKTIGENYYSDLKDSIDNNFEKALEYIMKDKKDEINREIINEKELTWFQNFKLTDSGFLTLFGDLKKRKNKSFIVRKCIKHFLIWINNKDNLEANKKREEMILNSKIDAFLKNLEKKTSMHEKIIYFRSFLKENQEDITFIFRKYIEKSDFNLNSSISFELFLYQTYLEVLG